MPLLLFLILKAMGKLWKKFCKKKKYKVCILERTFLAMP